MSNKKQTAVEWLAGGLELAYQIEETALRNFSIKKLIEQAKEIEKQQIIDAHLDGQSLVSCKDEYAEQYYNKTFNKEKKDYEQ
jgi:vacuolar-type H+-ATPase subunit H